MISVCVRNVDYIWIGVTCDEQHIFSTCFGPSRQEALKSLLDGLPFNVPFQVLPEPTAFAETALATVKYIYDGKGASRGVPFAMEHLSAYTRRVLEVTALIPVGYVAFYGGVAEATGGSARAVGNVMARNPFAPVVPCHRVICSDFTLGGYGGGLGMKLRLLEREKRGHKSSREIAVGERKLRVYPVESVLSKLN